MDSLGIRFRVSYKDFFEKEALENKAQKGEIVFAEDTNEWGLSISENEILWRKHDPKFFSNTFTYGSRLPEAREDTYGYLFLETTNGQVYYNNYGTWEKLRKNLPENDFNKYLLRNTVPDYDDTSNILLKDGSRTLPEDYFPSDDLDIVSQKIALLFAPITQDNNKDVFYNPELTEYVYDTSDIVSINRLKSGKILYLPPTQDPQIEGVIWNDNGVVRLSKGSVTFAATVWASQEPVVTHAKKKLTELSREDGKPLSGEDAIVTITDNGDGSWDLIAYDAEWIAFMDFDNQDSKGYISKIELNTCDVKTLYFTFSLVDNMSDFVVNCSASSVQDFSGAWNGCSALTSFPVLDTSNGTNFSNAWNGCSSLTSFPQLDVSNGDNFLGTWASCSSLTSFPQLDVSSGTDFSYAWYNCTALPYCPAGNEVTIPAGAITTDMCGGTCCFGMLE